MLNPEHSGEYKTNVPTTYYCIFSKIKKKTRELKINLNVPWTFCTNCPPRS